MEQDKAIEKEKADKEEDNRFFYDRSSRADYGEWTKKGNWSVDQATALLLGKNPDIVNWKVVNPLVYKSRFAKRYAELRQQIIDLNAAGDVGDLFGR